MHTWSLVVKLLVIFEAETLLGPHEVLGNLHATPIRCLNLEIGWRLIIPGYLRFIQTPVGKQSPSGSQKDHQFHGPLPS